LGSAVCIAVRTSNSREPDERKSSALKNAEGNGGKDTLSR